MILDHLPILENLVEFLNHFDVLKLQSVSPKIALMLAPLLLAKNTKRLSELPAIWKAMTCIDLPAKTSRGAWTESRSHPYLYRRVERLCLDPTFIDNIRHITELPLLKGISNFINLRTICIYNWKHRYWYPENWYLSASFSELCHLVNLTKLRLRAKLTIIPPEIKHLTNLSGLILEDNQITEIPEELGQLTNLKFLNLGRNCIRRVPNSLGNLTKLKHLYLHDNLLSELPDSLAKINQYLTVLKLNNNQFSKFPTVVSNFKKLKALDLRGNFIEQLPLNKNKQ